MTLQPYHLHPAAVHFPTALLAAGGAAAAARTHPRSPSWLGPASSALLGLGMVSLWVAVGLGLWAEETAPHKPLAWEVMADHETLAWATTAAFTLLAGVQEFVNRTKRDAPRWRWGMALGWVAAYALLVATAMHGAELVYGFGLGVGAP